MSESSQNNTPKASENNMSESSKPQKKSFSRGSTVLISLLCLNACLMPGYLNDKEIAFALKQHNQAISNLTTVLEKTQEKVLRQEQGLLNAARTIDILVSDNYKLKQQLDSEKKATQTAFKITANNLLSGSFQPLVYQAQRH